MGNSQQSGPTRDINSEKNTSEELSLSTKSGSQSDFGKQSKAHTSHIADSQPPLVLTLEQKTPMARWIIIAVLGLLGFGILTYWINADNPKINATALAAMNMEALPTPTLVANESGYSARVEYWPPNPVPSGSTMTFTSTLYLNGVPVPNANVQIALASVRGIQRSIKGQPTGPDGVSVTTFNIARMFGEFEVKVNAGFFDGDKVLVRATNSFTPRH